MSDRQPVLEVRDLAIDIHSTRSDLAAVRGVSFSVGDGECLGIVGESGSGKSLTCRALLGLTRAPARVRGGEVLFGGRDLLQLGAKELNEVRGAQIAMVFQDPLSSLNPLWSIGVQLTDVIRRHTGASRAEARARAIECLEEVGFPAARDRLKTYPFELSGGLRQRVMIAMALACKPCVVVADEPTSALDVSVQAQILDLLHQLKAAAGFSLILVTHDVGVGAFLADRVLIMYGGQVMEAGGAYDVLNRPSHPYSHALLECSVAHEDLRPVAGFPPSLEDMPSGCPFEPRCARSSRGCTEPVPVTRFDDRSVACIHPVSTGYS